MTPKSPPRSQRHNREAHQYSSTASGWQRCNLKQVYTDNSDTPGACHIKYLGIGHVAGDVTFCATSGVVCTPKLELVSRLSEARQHHSQGPRERRPGTSRHFNIDVAPALRTCWRTRNVLVGRPAIGVLVAALGSRTLERKVALGDDTF